jgi:hypothetical protein
MAEKNASIKTYERLLGDAKKSTSLMQQQVMQ